MLVIGSAIIAVYQVTEEAPKPAYISTSEAVETPPEAQICPVSEVIPEKVETPTQEDLLLKCSCVSYVRELIAEKGGKQFPQIPDPSYLKPNAPPEIGGIVLFTFGGYPHIGEIMDFRPYGMFIKHQYLSGTKCVRTTGYVEYKDIRGAYRP